MDIQSAGPTKTGPWRPTLDSTTLNASHFNHFSGVLGVGMRLSQRNNGVASPQAQMPGMVTYLVKFPKYTKTQGQVILNPNDADLKGFTYFQLQPDSALLPNGFNSYLDNQLNGTIVINGNSGTTGTLLDSGNPVTEVTATTLTGSGLVNKQIQVQLQLAPPGQTLPLIIDQFKVATQTAGRDRVLVVPVSASNQPHLVFGTNIFFSYDIFFDEKNGRIGLRKK